MVDDVGRLLAEREKAHQGDRDGGYALVRDLLEVLGGVDEPGRRSARARLLAWVDARDPRMWGVALETLVQEGSADTPPALEARLRSGEHDGEWREQVLLALLRLRYAPARDLYAAHVEAGMREGRPFVLRLLQHLYALDRERALALSARYFGEHLPGQEDELKGFAQGQLTALAELDESLVPELVRRTSAVRPLAGRRLARLFAGNLEMPWLRERIGADRAARLAEGIAHAAD